MELPAGHVNLEDENSKDKRPRGTGVTSVLPLGPTRVSLVRPLWPGSTAAGVELSVHGDISSRVKLCTGWIMQLRDMKV